MRVEIHYLGAVVIETGEATSGHDGRYENGHFFPRRPTRGVEPTVFDLDAPTGVQKVFAGWGDRVRRGATPPVWVDMIDGSRVERRGESKGLWVCGYSSTDAALDDMLAHLEALVAEAWQADIASRADVAAVVEWYRATVFDALDVQYAEHQRQWERDRAQIARLFRRRRVEVGEQTVPGKCVVRSSRGNTLGYADVWDGKWLGTIERRG